MKQYFLTLCIAACALALFGQEAPRWVDGAEREHAYPSSAFITGFASEMLRPTDNIAQAQERLKKEAQKNLSENIRLKIEGATKTSDKSQQMDGKEYISSTYDASVRTSSNAEITGVKTDVYFDSRKNVAYAFAYANKYEVIGYYTANVSMLVQQAEGLLRTAEQLESSKEKAKARRQCEQVIPLLAKVRYAQDMLTALSGNADSESLQQEASERLRSEATQMLARLAQGLYLYMESDEDVFGKKVSIMDKRLKAILAKNGCSFTDDAAQADLKLTLSTTTRVISGGGEMVFCYADTEIALYDNFKQKNVFADEVSQKGGGVSQERAGRKALESIAPKVAEKIMPWIKN
jgi:hypothetical protein